MRAGSSRGAAGPRSGTPSGVWQQLAPNRPGDSQLRCRVQCFAGSLGMPNYGGRRTVPPIVDNKQYSAFSWLLSLLDQQPLYNGINFDVPVQDPYLFSSGGGDRGVEANRTPMGMTLAVFLCPSDSGTGDPGWTGGINYRINLGSDRWPTLSADSTCGPFLSYRITPISAVVDGLSNTVGLSEKLRGRVAGRTVNPRTDMIVGGLGLPYTPDESRSRCMNLGGTPEGFFTEGGLTWFVGTLSQTCYNHVIEPNTRDSRLHTRFKPDQRSPRGQIKPSRWCPCRDGRMGVSDSSSIQSAKMSGGHWPPGREMS